MAVQSKDNDWIEVLRKQHEVFDASFGWYQRLHALLTLKVQARLLWARLSGRFSYGIYRAFALWSLLRLLPWAVLLAGIIVGGVWWQRTLERYHAESLLADIPHHDEGLSQAQAEAWRNLAAQRDHARLHAIKRALEPASAPKLSAQADRFVHVVLGLDIDGSLSRQLIHTVLVPALQAPHFHRDSAPAMARVSVHLHYQPETAFAMAAALTKRMEVESDSAVLASLGEAFDAFSTSLNSQHVPPLAAALIRRMRGELDSCGLVSLGGARGALSRHLTRADVQPGAVALIARMQTEKDSARLMQLGRTLNVLSPPLTPQDVQPGAVILVKRMETERDITSLGHLHSVLDALSLKLARADVPPLAAVLVKRMETEVNSEVLMRLGKALGTLSPSLARMDVQPGAVALVTRMQTEGDSSMLGQLASTLSALSPPLTSQDVHPGAVALVTRIGAEENSYALQQLGKALAALGPKLDPQDVQPLAAVLVSRMKAEANTEVLGSLGGALGVLSAKLDPKDIQPAATALFRSLENAHTGLSIHAWLVLEAAANRYRSDKERLEEYIKVLQLPLLTRDDRDTVLNALGNLTGQKFEGDLWRFVTWATTSEKTKSWRLPIHSGRPYIRP